MRVLSTSKKAAVLVAGVGEGLVVLCPVARWVASAAWKAPLTVATPEAKSSSSSS